MNNAIREYIRLERKISSNPDYAAKCALPSKCYLLGDGVILCYPRSDGDSRYPYSCDGLTLWAYSSGYISLNEGTYYFIPLADDGKQPYCAFFGGIKNKDDFSPVSITGVASNYPDNARRFTVFTPEAAYYIAQQNGIVFYLRAFMTKDKKAAFTLGAINKTKSTKKIYLSAYFNCLCMHQPLESCETKWFKRCDKTENGFVFEGLENIDRTTTIRNYGGIFRSEQKEPDESYSTCSRADFVGSVTKSLNCALSLFSGKIKNCTNVCIFNDTAIAGEIIRMTLDPAQESAIDYVLTASNDKKIATAFIPADYVNTQLKIVKAEIKAMQTSPTSLKMQFSDIYGINGEKFTEFIANVKRQVEFAALAKNSGVSLLGVRDAAQQIEVALIELPKKARAKIIDMLSYLDPSGRAPRQYAPAPPGGLPTMDTREFIDQGLWIISCLYTYLSYTDDASILNETCGYYKIVGKNKAEATDKKDTVYDHIYKIIDFLLNNIDEKTNCLRALYGDWNDALDGLGVSNNGKEFGSGVSIMASLQLYQSLGKMVEILDRYGDRYNDKIRYLKARERLKSGITQNAIVEKDGKRKIVHGWGDNCSYMVGSFSDVDGKDRYTLTSAAFFVISEAYLWDTSLKSDILNCFDHLQSKYGLKTFEPYFDKDVKGVGRIVNLPKGAAENSAVYVHAALFGVKALFLLGDDEAAWDNLIKLLPITHERITTSPFIMSNSYCFNPELNLDGESMSDWFTGSANTLLKIIIQCVFGVVPSLTGLDVSPAAFIPTKSASLSLCVKGKRVTVKYDNAENGKRVFKVNGKKYRTTTNGSKGSPMITIATGALKNNTVIEIID